MVYETDAHNGMFFKETFVSWHQGRVSEVTLETSV